MKRKEALVFGFVACILMLLFLAIAGSDILVATSSADELNRMGVQRKS